MSSSATLSTEARQAPLSMGFFRQEYWSWHALLRGSSWPRDRTHVSCVPCGGGRFLYRYCHRAYLGTSIWFPLRTGHIFLVLYMLGNFKCPGRYEYYVVDLGPVENLLETADAFVLEGNQFRFKLQVLSYLLYAVVQIWVQFSKPLLSCSGGLGLSCAHII